MNILDELPRQLSPRLHHEPRVRHRDALGRAQLAFVKRLAEGPALVLVHLVAGLADQALHVGVNAPGADGHARNVGLLDGEVRRDGVRGGLGAAVGSPRGVGRGRGAGGDPDDAALGLAQRGDGLLELVCVRCAVSGRRGAGVAYQAEAAEDVYVIVLLPVLDGGVCEALDGLEDAVVDDHAVELAEGLDGECRHLAGCLRSLALLNKFTEP